jgi:hypothetical protein
MTETPPNRSSSSPTEEPEQSGTPQSDATAPQQRSYAPLFAKGCGCMSVCIIFGIGVAVVGRGELASVGSAIVGVLFLVLIVGSSGLTGWWHKR